MRFADSVEAGMTPAELTQWESNPLSAAVPAVTIDGTRLFANYLGYVFAVDLEGGKMLWRSASFHHLEVSAMQDQARMLDPSRFAVVASGEHVWTLGRDLKEQNFLAPFRLICRRADGGEVVWQSTDLPDYAGLDLVGPPLLADGKLFIAAKTQANPAAAGPAAAARPGDPAPRRQGALEDRGRHVPARPAVLLLRYAANRRPSRDWSIARGALYVDTHVGVLARLDAESGALDWGYGYQTDPSRRQDRFFYYRRLLASRGARGSSRRSGPARPS